MPWEGLALEQLHELPESLWSGGPADIAAVPQSVARIVAAARQAAVHIAVAVARQVAVRIAVVVPRAVADIAAAVVPRAAARIAVVALRVAADIAAVVPQVVAVGMPVVALLLEQREQTAGPVALVVEVEQPGPSLWQQPFPFEENTAEDVHPVNFRNSLSHHCIVEAACCLNAHFLISFVLIFIQ